MSERMLLCDSVGLHTTGISIFTIVTNLQWEKSLSLTKDGSAEMVGKYKGVSAFVKKKESQQ